ncbi:MAG: type II toxin-antitoxin system RelE family toxin [Brevinematia bacterium]
MKVLYSKAFDKDIDKINDKEIFFRLNKVIEEVKVAKDKRYISNMKKIKGSKDYYRIKIGDYRIGIKVNDRGDEVEFIRFAHRKDIYKYFP